MPGDKIIREGEKGNEMYFLAEGIVEVLAKTKDKKPVSVFLKKGSYFGEVFCVFSYKFTIRSIL